GEHDPHATSSGTRRFLKGKALMPSMVVVVDTDHQPLSPCHPARARQLLALGRAAVWRRYPCTTILRRAGPDAHPEPPQVKIGPGSQTTGLAVVSAASGQRIGDALLARRAVRRSRRQRHTRYRPARFTNRRRRAGWLPPSLESRRSNVLTWVERLRRI